MWTPLTQFKGKSSFFTQKKEVQSNRFGMTVLE